MQIIISSITSALQALGIEYDQEIQLEHPADPDHGDYSTNIAMKLFATVGKEKGYSNPRSFAEVLVEKLGNWETPLSSGQTGKLEVDQVSKSPSFQVSVAGPGFINFSLSEEWLVAEMQRVNDQENISINNENQGKAAIVEYSSPNIAKPFTIGHLRSTIIGDAIANLLEATGYQVFRDNHLGDWGTQFGKQIYAIKTWGDEKVIANSDNPVKELVALYVRFHEEAEKDPSLEDEARAWFKKLEDGDAEAKRLWQACIDWSWTVFEKMYQQLSVTFTENNGRGYGESFFENKMAEIILELREKNLLEVGEKGAELVFFPNDELPAMMILKKDGSTLYATRDLATDKFRKTNPRYKNVDLIINEVGAEQSLYFKQLYRLEEMLGWFNQGERVHVGHGLYRFKDKKMSTRKGNVIWLEDVLAEAINKAKIMIAASKKGNFDDSVDLDQLAQAIGIGALKWNDLKRTSSMAIMFDWDEILNMQGNSGPYIQYSYARTQSILRKNVESGMLDIDLHSTLHTSTRLSENTLQPNQEEKAILRIIYQFPEIVSKAAKEYAPHLVASYLFDLAQSFNTFYAKHSVLGEDVAEETKEFRLQLTQAVGKILKSGLNLLGIVAPERM